jgi:hypothetical protein
MVVVLAACSGGGGGGGGHSGSGPTTSAPDRAADQQRAQSVGFHIYDFPSGWTEAPINGGGFDISGAVTACLPQGDPATGKAVASSRDDWSQTLTNAVAAYITVLDSPATADAAFKARDTDAFRACFRGGMESYIRARQGAGQTPPNLTLTDKALTLANVASADYEMVSSPTSPGGPSAYLSFVFLQHGRILTVLNFFSTSQFPPALQASLIEAVAGRMGD